MLTFNYTVKPISSFCAFDKGQLSLDLPLSTMETNGNKKDYSWYKKRCCSPVLIGESPLLSGSSLEAASQWTGQLIFPLSHNEVGDFRWLVPQTKTENMPKGSSVPVPSDLTIKKCTSLLPSPLQVANWSDPTSYQKDKPWLQINFRDKDGAEGIIIHEIRLLY